MHLKKNTLYYSLVYLYLSYCSLVWGKAYDIHLKPLEILQKRCIWIINYKTFLEHIEPLFYSNEILKLKDIYRFKLACFMQKLPNLTQFLNSHNYETRSVKTFNRNTIDYPFANNKFLIIVQNSGMKSVYIQIKSNVEISL